MESKIKFGVEYFAGTESETFVVSRLIDETRPQLGTKNVIFSSSDEFINWLRNLD